MNVSEISGLVTGQKNFFATGATRGFAFRAEMLKRLETMIREHEDEITDALHADLRKPWFEAWGGEIGIVLSDVRHTRKHLRRWMKPEKVSTPFVHFPAKSRIMPEPFGVSLIVGPWNYPFQLLAAPLIGAIAAGNTAILKTAPATPAVSALVAKIVPEYFHPEYIAVAEGGREINRALFAEAFDFIFYTGNTEVGREVMSAAAKHLTPVVLELGGKSPCIVHSDADVSTAAKRIVWGKFYNAGQTCVAPDYLLVQKSVKDALVKEIREVLKAFYGSDPQASPDYARVVNVPHFTRLAGMLAGQKILAGGNTDPSERYIAPTLIDEPSPDSAVMKDEIFGPIMPVLSYDTLDDAIRAVNSRPKPLALYVFSRGRGTVQRVLSETSSGGAAVNETLSHMTTSHLPFGGVGESGMGSYHGRASFDCFSHRKSVLDKPEWFDFWLRYPPYRRFPKSLKGITERLM
jgi:aldehyde dehydrogenase (NAD+)